MLVNRGVPMGGAASKKLAPPRCERSFGLEGLETYAGGPADATPCDEYSQLTKERARLGQMVASRAAACRVNLV